jgi:protein O-mannosyl-transferase
VIKCRRIVTGMGPDAEAPSGSGVGSVVLFLVVLLLTVVTFAPTLRHQFVGLDDGTAFVGNVAYRGLGWPQLRWMFTTTLLENYVPVAWLSLGLDYRLWGMDPAGYHLTSVLLHAVGAGLFYLVALHLLGRATGLTGGALRLAAFTAALFFALHPLRAESVAWVSERRDVLAGVFFFITVLLYCRAADTAGARRRRLLVASVGAYLLALGSKPMVMTVPAVLVLLDLYPLRRLPGDPRRWLDPGVRWLWIEKVPYAALGLAGGLTSYLVHAGDAAVGTLPASSAIAKACYSLWFHTYKTLLPLGLSPMYELPVRADLLEPRFLAATLAAVGLTGLALRFAAGWPAGLTVWAYQALVLAPVSGVVQAGYQITADRFSYLAGLGWALLVGAAAGTLWRTARSASRGRVLCRIGAGVVGLWIGVLAVQTWHQVQIWRTTDTLWQRALAVDPACAICRSHLAASLMQRGQTSAAIAELARAATLRPDRYMAWGRLGQAYDQAGLWPEAIAAYRRELSLRPRAVDARIGLGGVLVKSGRPAEALEELRPALADAPNQPAVHIVTGQALAVLGRSPDAVAHFQRAIALGARDGAARLGLAWTYLQLGERGLAREQYDVLVTLDPPRAAALRTVLDGPAPP